MVVTEGGIMMDDREEQWANAFFLIIVKFDAMTTAVVSCDRSLAPL